MKPYQPTPVGEVSAYQADGRWTLVFVRELAHAPERVWRALTDPDELAEWSPFDSDRDLSRTGPATLTMAGGDGSETSAITVRRADRPAVLEYTWDEDVLRWELEPIPSGTRLTLRHTLADEEWRASVAGGWHICLDVAERLLAGEPVGRIVGEDGKRHGWDGLRDAYAERLGLPGLPPR